MTTTTDRQLVDLRDGKLREIGPKVRKLSWAGRRAVSEAVCGELAKAVSAGNLDHAHRWLVTTLQFLAPPDAGELVTRALGRTIHLTNCCGCVRNRLLRTVGAIRPVGAVPALVDIICKVDNPAHKQLAVVCIEKIVKARGAEASALLANQKSGLRRELNRLKKAVVTTKRVTPPKPWIHTPGSAGRLAATARAINAISRLLTQRGD